MDSTAPPASEAAALQVRSHELQALGALVDEHALGRPSGQRLYAKLACTREEVEHPPALDVELYNVEHGLLDHVGRWPDLHSAGLKELAPAGSSTGYNFSCFLLLCRVESVVDRPGGVFGDNGAKLLVVCGLYCLDGCRRRAAGRCGASRPRWVCRRGRSAASPCAASAGTLWRSGASPPVWCR